MNNEPVGWFEQDPDMKSIWYQSDQDSPNAIPLYTHPANLTDEEIFKTAIENGAYQNKKSGHIYPDDMYILNFARAILRKAQEK